MAIFYVVTQHAEKCEDDVDVLWTSTPVQIKNFFEEAVFENSMDEEFTLIGYEIPKEAEKYKNYPDKLYQKFIVDKEFGDYNDKVVMYQLWSKKMGDSKYVKH